MGLVRHCVEYAKSRDKSLTFGLATNGTLLNEQVRRFVVDHDFSVYVSLDGPGPIHDQARRFAGGGGTFDLISRNMRALRDLAPEYYARRVTVQCTMSPGIDLFKLLDFFANASDLIGEVPPRIGLQVPGIGDGVSATQRAAFNSGLADLEERYLQKVVREERGDTQFTILRAMFENPYLVIHQRRVRPNGRGESFHTAGTCFPGNFRLFVHADGTYLPCVRSADALEIGNVEKGLDVAKICKIYRAYHDLHQNECRMCWAMSLCVNCIALDTQRTGRCEADLYPPRCDEERDFWKDKLTKYASVLEQNPRAFEYLQEVTVFQARVPLLDDLPVSTLLASGVDAVPNDGLMRRSEQLPD